LYSSIAMTMLVEHFASVRNVLGNGQDEVS